MVFDYSEMLKELDRRRFGPTDSQIILNESKTLRHDYAAYESLNKAKQYHFLKENDIVKYLIGSMFPVSKNYTQQIVHCRKSIENILSQMNENIYKDFPVEFRYQGSVSNNTHIKRYSDVDLLVIIGAFETLEHPQKPKNPYKGIPENDLLELRNNCINQIKKVMPTLLIDDSGAKSVALKGEPLITKIDVVPANWFNSVNYSKTLDENDRGIQIYNKKLNKRILNYPFKFNDKLKQKDMNTAGVFKQAIRLLKNIKADTERKLNKKISFSSYAISSMLYSVNNSKYFIGTSPLTLIRVINEILSKYSNELTFKNLKDPLGEPLNSSETIEGVLYLQSATQLIINDIGQEINKEIKIDII